MAARQYVDVVSVVDAVHGGVVAVRQKVFQMTTLHALPTAYTIHAYKSAGAVNAVRLTAYIVDESGNYIVDESGNRIVAVYDASALVIHAQATNYTIHAE